jgi:hypothetical protein
VIPASWLPTPLPVLPRRRSIESEDVMKRTESTRIGRAVAWIVVSSLTLFAAPAAAVGAADFRLSVSSS